jgi:hypothetical protein
MMMQSVPRALTCLAMIIATLAAAGRSPAAEYGPQGVVRQFCQVDGNGQRVSIPGWAAIAPLVTWAYEPAWDTVSLISGYEVGGPKPAGENTLAVEVRYTVVGQLSPAGVNQDTRVEPVVYQVQPDEQGSWHIVGALPPPHIFANRVDTEAMRRSLAEGGVNFLANSVFVWQMFQSAGWDVPFQSTSALLGSATYRAVEPASPGDLVVYLRDGTPYHVGLLEAKNQVVSSTLNAGITRTAVDAFPGEVRYLRLARPGPSPTAAPALPAGTLAIAPEPTTSTPKPTRRVTAVKQRTPARRGKQPRKPTPARRRSTPVQKRPSASHPTPTRTSS